MPVIYHFIIVMLSVWTNISTAEEASSDLVNIYYQHYLEQESSGSTATSLSILDKWPTEGHQLGDEIAAEIAAKLDPFGLSYDMLPPLLQLAVLWDSGYASTDNGSLARIYTRCSANNSGVVMNNITLGSALMSKAGCKTHSCQTKNGASVSWSFSSDCGPDQLDGITQCACTPVKAQATEIPVWTRVPAGRNDIPYAQIRRHIWSNITAGRSAIVYAIHTQGNLDAIAGKVTGSSEICSSQNNYVALTIPCIEYHVSDTRWCRPKSSPQMTQWLSEYTLSVVEKWIKLAASSGLSKPESDSFDIHDSGMIEGYNATFAFDGTSSDLAQQFYSRYLEGDDVLPLSLTESQLPDEVQERLDTIGLSFNQLSPLLQRALLWDSGYVFQRNSSRILDAVYTQCGLTMADIAVSKKDIEGAGCQIISCNEKSTNASNRALGCHIDSVYQCAISDDSEPVENVAMWADGGCSVAVPDVNIVRHSHNGTVVYSLHTAHNVKAGETCPRKDMADSMVIPCRTYATNLTGWCRPKPGVLVTSWLSRERDQMLEPKVLQVDSTPGDWHQTVPVLVVGGLSLIVTATAVYIYLKRSSTEQEMSSPRGTSNASDWGGRTIQLPARSSPVANEDMTEHPKSMNAFLSMLSSSPSVWGSSPLSLSLTQTAEDLASTSPHRGNCGNFDILEALMHDSQLRKIPFSQLQFHHLIARGTHSEVWLCVLHSRCVAVKRLPKRRSNHIKCVKAFARSIRLNSPLKHPNILSYIGMAWNSVQNLCLVTEYLEHGDLHEFLRRSDPNLEPNDSISDFMCFSLSWKREKMKIALDVTRGMAYLHQLNIIHADVRAKSILLSSGLDAKLKGIGWSAGDKDRVKFKVDASFWTAPEVLAGNFPSKKSDVYSFGILLTELDTHDTPYADAVAVRGRLLPLQKLQQVVSGQLKPSLSPSCPAEIVQLCDWCLHQDPNARPNAEEIIQAILDIPGVNVDVFSL